MLGEFTAAQRRCGRWFRARGVAVVRARVPRSQLFIVGARPPADVRALGDFAGIRRRRTPGVPQSWSPAT